MKCLLSEDSEMSCSSTGQMSGLGGMVKQCCIGEARKMHLSHEKHRESDVFKPPVSKTSQSIRISSVLLKCSFIQCQTEGQLHNYFL